MESKMHKMRKINLDVNKYWEDRLASNLNLKGTGHRAFNLAYNQYLYQAQADCLTSLLDKCNVNLLNKTVLDVGCGTGFFVDYYLSRGSQKILGIDISETSVQYLKERFPTQSFAKEDIANSSLAHLGCFDFISAISVLYHIVDDQSFNQAVKNLCSLCNPRGYLLISDTFSRHWLPSAPHAHLRTLAEYQQYFENFKIFDLTPIYYFLNRAFIPFIGPKLIDLFNLGSLFYRLDGKMRSKGWGNGSGMKFLLAQRMI